MNDLIKPDWIINSIYHLDGQDLLDLGFKGLIVDLDNTLLAWNEYEPSERMLTWLDQMTNRGLKIFLLSNNNPSRVAKALGKSQIPYRARALKPLGHSFRAALGHLSLPKDQVVVIGDQLVTDVIGAKRNQLKVILVKPLVNHDIIYTWLNRAIEKVLMKKIGLSKQADWGDKLNAR